MPKNHTSLASSLNLSGLEEATVELGVSALPLLRRFGLDPQQLKKSENYVSAVVITEFLEAAAHEFDCPHFAILLARHRPNLAFGVLAQIIKASPDVGTALTNAHRHLRMWTQATGWELETQGEQAILIRTAHYQATGSMRQAVLLSLAIYTRLLQGLLGPNWSPEVVNFTMNAPSELQYYRRFFRAKLAFDQEYDGLRFPASDLATPISSSDPELLAIIEQHIASLEQVSGDSLRDKVELLIRQQLDSRSCNLDGISARLGMHSKAVQRTLVAEGTSFKQLLNEARLKLAEFYLRNSSIDLLQLSSILGYSCPSALSRGFKNQHGVSPQAWRKRHTPEQ